MNMLFLVIMVLLGGLLYVAFSSLSGRGIATTEDFFLAGRSLSAWQIMFTLLATQIGGGMLLGTAQQAYTLGWYGILYSLSMVIGFFLLGAGIAERLQSFNVGTTAELFEHCYNSVLLRRIASCLSVVTLYGILVSQIVASKSLFSALGVTNTPFFILFWGAIISYTMAGGLHAVVIADTYQVVYILLIFSLSFMYALVSNTISITAIAQSLPATTTTAFDGMNYMSILIIPALFSLIEQDLAQRFFAARSARAAALGAFGASVLLLAFSCVPLYFGAQAYIHNLQIPVDGSPLIIALKYLVGDFVAILAACGVIAAISSTADSLLCAISSNIVQDLVPSEWYESHVVLSRTVTALTGFLALGASWWIPTNIIGLLVESYALSVNCLLIPLLFVYFHKVGDYRDAWASVVVGFIVSVAYLQPWLPMPYSSYSLLLPLVCSCIAYGVMYGVRRVL